MPQEENQSQVTEQPNQEQAPIATLLSSISYTNQADYENFLANLTPEHSLIVLVAAANHCQAKGVFTIDESELIAKSIRKLSAPAADSSEQVIEPDQEN
jgi:hypothetical protein